MIETRMSPLTQSAGLGCQAAVNGQPSEITFKHMRFLITDRPTEATLDRYIEVLNKKRVKDLVRVCDPTYDTRRLQSLGIQVIDWPYEDGQVPPRGVIDEWLSLLKTRFAGLQDSCIAVHCVSGLGRAPVLVAVALIELGMKYDQAVELIRMKRRGAINQKQLDFLEHYRPKCHLDLKSKEHQSKEHRPCSIQ